MNKTEEEVADFLTKGGNINYRESYATPLQMAARMGGSGPTGDVGRKVGMVAWVTFLLAHGADTEATVQREADTPLTLARDNPEIVRLLLEHKAQVNVRTTYRVSLFTLALGHPATPPARRPVSPRQPRRICSASARWRKSSPRI